MDTKKNTILLTVIAIATLLVAVVGATFAYFTAQGGDASEAKVTVSTGTAGNSTLGTYKPINIYADATNFGQGKGNLSDTSTGSVTWTAPGGDDVAAADLSFCYTAKLAVTENTFVYSSTNTTQAAELTLKAEKNGTILLDDRDITVGKADVLIPTEKDGSETIHKITATPGGEKSDNWTLTVTLVNLGVDQNDNTSKQFSGVVQFTKTDCK